MKHSQCSSCAQSNLQKPKHKSFTLLQHHVRKLKSAVDMKHTGLNSSSSRLVNVKEEAGKFLEGMLNKKKKSSDKVQILKQHSLCHFTEGTLWSFITITSSL